MARIPILLNLLDELGHEAAYNPSYYDNDFGLGLHPQHIHSHSRYPGYHHEPFAANMLRYAMPQSLLLSSIGKQQMSRRGDKNKNEGKITAVGKDGFQVCMDVQQFKPSELIVKVVDKYIVVEGKHEEREDDHGYIARHFVRRYALPEDYDADKVVSTLSSDGVLTVSVPKPVIEDKSCARVIHIQQTGPAHLNIKENTPQEIVGDGVHNVGDNMIQK